MCDWAHCPEVSHTHTDSADKKEEREREREREREIQNRIQIGNCPCEGKGAIQMSTFGITGSSWEGFQS